LNLPAPHAAALVSTLDLLSGQADGQRGVSQGNHGARLPSDQGTAVSLLFEAWLVLLSLSFCHGFLTKRKGQGAGAMSSLQSLGEGGRNGILRFFPFFFGFHGGKI
jgi:hypothetical protein